MASKRTGGAGANLRSRIPEDTQAELAPPVSLPVHADPAPAEPPPAPEPPPESMPPAPDEPEDVGAEPRLAVTSAQLEPLAGQLFARINVWVCARYFPEQPLTEQEQQALADGVGPLLAHYLPEHLDGVWLLWATALGSIAMVYGPRVAAAKEPPLEEAPPAPPAP